eukprot:2635395-Amphidinium_carterae.1
MGHDDGYEKCGARPEFHDNHPCLEIANALSVESFVWVHNKANGRKTAWNVFRGQNNVLTHVDIY